MTSIKHAGLPWELGLAEAQQVLMLNGLRDRLIAESPRRDSLLPLIEEDIARLVQAAELPGTEKKGGGPEIKSTPDTAAAAPAA